LGTTVEARVCCDAPVAARLHRAMGAAIDSILILLGFAVFVAAMFFFPRFVSLPGFDLVLNRPNLAALAGAAGIVAFAYGALWAIAGRETAGMAWAGLRVLTFDGLAPDRRQRMGRFAASCLSLATAVGLLWCLADEERLTWTDHISGTFPTPRSWNAPGAGRP
jgi:uncharacterized RDD family membrane protein YckC